LAKSSATSDGSSECVVCARATVEDSECVRKSASCGELANAFSDCVFWDNLLTFVDDITVALQCDKMSLVSATKLWKSTLGASIQITFHDNQNLFQLQTVPLLIQNLVADKGRREKFKDRNKLMEKCNFE
jgi:hypothetical protein